MGRPTIYTPEIGALICERLCDGVSLSKICAADDMPSRSAVCKWLVSTDDTYKDFQVAHALARRAGAYAMGDDCLDISDDGSNDTMLVGRDDEAREVTNHEVIARSKQRIDVRKFLMSKYAPEVFGDRIAVGGVPDQPIEIKDMSPRDIGRRIAFVLAGGAKLIAAE